jgi:tetratricopeptide (TPR) repeat protein
LYIEARYYTTVTKDHHKALEAYRLLTAIYPDDFAAHTNIGSLYRSRGMLKDAIESLEQATRLAPEEPLAHSNLAGAYLDVERFADARRELETAIGLRDSASARGGLYLTAIYLGDQPLADAQIEAVRGRRDEADMLPPRIGAALLLGRNNEAARLTDERFRRLRAANRLDSAGEALAYNAMSHAMVGRHDLARAEIQRVREHQLVTRGSSDEMVALGALLGDRQLADNHLDEAIANVREASLPEDRDKGERAMLALAALARGRNQEAYDIASSADVSDPLQRNLTFVAGTAAARLRRWPDAIRFFEGLRGLGVLLGTSSVPGTVRVHLARAYAAAGRTDEAKKAYEDAFTVWKNADADLPLLVEARKEYAALGS